MSAYKLPPNELRDFFHAGRHVRYQKGELILSAGSRPAGIYYIERGFIKVYTISKRGEEYVHLVFKPGEIFPLIWMIKNKSYDAFYEALDEAALWRAPKDKFLTFVKGSQAVSYSLLEQMAGQLDIHIDRLDNLEYKQAGERVAFRLVALSKRFGRKHKGQILIDAPFTHQLIADSINLSRESVSREIKKLQQEGIVTYHSHKLLIRDLPAVAKKLD